MKVNKEDLGIREEEGVEEGGMENDRIEKNWVFVFFVNWVLVLYFIYMGDREFNWVV